MRKSIPLLTIVSVLAACSPKPESMEERVADADGAAAIAFELTSAREASGHFRLSNPTSQAIAFGSTHESSEGVHARDVQLKCKPAGSAEWHEGPRSMGDSPVSRIEVPPGSTRTVIVLWEPGLLQAYAGGACRVDLRLEDGSIVASNEFAL